MPERTYKSGAIDIRFDASRCIHAAECVHGLPEVFDPDRKPWVKPAQADADKLAEVVMRCPTGALHFDRKDEGAAEQPDPEADVSVRPNGPLFLRGDITILDAEGNELLQDTRVALCRCGQSKNMPFCNGAHVKAGFEDAGEVRELEPEEHEIGPITVSVQKDGPALVRGRHVIFDGQDEPSAPQKVSALCRCGGSKGKPFCDGSHVVEGFEG
jgi:CDGSH-type Zn-finger protein/uncharacterized Fe-S cluster protein YjdI